MSIRYDFIRKENVYFFITPTLGLLRDLSKKKKNGIF